MQGDGPRQSERRRRQDGLDGQSGRWACQSRSQGPAERRGFQPKSAPFHSAVAQKNSAIPSLLRIAAEATQGWLDADEVFSELERVCHDEEILFGSPLEDADAEAQ